MTPVAPPSSPTPRAHLLAWYDRHARALPRRAAPGERASPYGVWLSEIMLQQTTVAHATRYFLAFIRRWPTVEALAAAADEEVMAAWAGLGYYARARNLLACARRVVSVHGGAFPSSEAGLRALPGIGAYTAAAVGAIAFDHPTNVVDANVERVMARLFAVEAPLPGAKVELARLARDLVGPDRPGDWAQALMDLGAGICRPRAPLCDRCPISETCRAKSAGDPDRYPRRSPKAGRPHRHGAVFACMRGDAVALVRRPPRGLLGGMLGLPTTEWRSGPWTASEAIAAAPVVADWRELGVVTHVFTHFSLTLTVFGAQTPAPSADLVWRSVAEARAATPSVFSKALRLVVPA